MTSQALTPRERWLAFAILCLGDIMIVLDSTIVNVALPTIRTSLGFSETGLVWVVNSYLLTFGGFMLLGGRMADLYGQRLLWLVGIMVFTAASAACGLAVSQEMLVVARAVQGLGGAVVSAVALSLIMALFPDGPERVRAMGYFGFVMAGGGSVGVLLGGVLTGTLDWRSIFLVNLPIGALVIFLSMKLLPDARVEGGSRSLDVAGAVTITGSLLLAVYAVVNGEEAGWASAQTLGLIGGAIVLLLLFLLIESRVKMPLVPLGLFRLRNIAVSNIIGVLWAAAMFAWFFLSALYMQLVLNYGPMMVGLAFLPANLIMGAFSYSLSAKMVNRFGIRRPLAAGLGCAAAGLALFALAPADGSFVMHVLPAMLLLGVGAGHGVQSGAAGGDERCRCEGLRPRVGHRQHGLHDGRVAGPCRAGEPCGDRNQGEPRKRGSDARGADGRLQRGVLGGRGMRARGRTARLPAARASAWRGRAGAGDVH